MARYDGSFFQLRHEIDHLLNDDQPPRLVVYVPMERRKPTTPSIELEAAGVVMQPGQQPPSRNTRLSVVARNALQAAPRRRKVAEIEKQVEAGKLSLADLNALAEQGKDISTGVLTLIFGSANPQEVALAFLRATATTPRSRRRRPRTTCVTCSGSASTSNFPRTTPCRSCGSGWPGTSC